MEFAHPGFESNALSLVVMGAALSAVVGPELARHTRNALPTPYVGTYVLATGGVWGNLWCAHVAGCDGAALCGRIRSCYGGRKAAGARVGVRDTWMLYGGSGSAGHVNGT